MNDTISSQFPFESHYCDVLGSKMHYIDEGQGDPILFLHGIPTSSYLWRNIIPQLSQSSRCIAPDLMGMGKSDKPEINYTVFEHIDYLAQFIDELNLNNITLVMHAWGSVIGFAYAMKNPERIKALAFMESHVRPAVNWDMVALPVQDMSEIMKSPDGGKEIILNSNYYIDKVLPAGVLRNLSEEELDHYRSPFDTPDSRQPIWQYLQDLPLGEGPKAVIDLITDYSKKLQHSQHPKLMLYAVPGFNTTIDTVQWAQTHLANLKLVDIGDALHYAQESNPKLIADTLSDWYKNL